MFAWGWATAAAAAKSRTLSSRIYCPDMVHLDTPQLTDTNRRISHGSARNLAVSSIGDLVQARRMRSRHLATARPRGRASVPASSVSVWQVAALMMGIAGLLIPDASTNAAKRAANCSAAGDGKRLPALQGAVLPGLS